MVSFRDIYDPIRPQGKEHLRLKSLYQRCKNDHEDVMAERLNLDPDYQRGRVWAEEQKKKFIGFLLEGGRLDPFLIRRHEDYRIPDEIIDGKQRITSIIEFFENKVAAQIIDGTEFFLSDFSEEEQAVFKRSTNYSVELWYFTLSRKKVLELYLKINRGGTPHSEEEIQRVYSLYYEELSNDD